MDGNSRYQRKSFKWQTNICGIENINENTTREFAFNRLQQPNWQQIEEKKTEILGASSS